MNIRKILLLAGLAIVGLIVFNFARSLSTPPPPQIIETPVEPAVAAVEYTDVLVATAEIPFGTRLSAPDFRWQQWPTEVVSNDFITSDERPQAITNLSGGVARSIIYEGEPISDRKIVKPGESGLMASLLTPGMRAVTTRISVDTAAGGFIQPGDRVDIILTSVATSIVTTQSTGTRQYTATTIFENVRVLAIDQTFSSSSDAGATVIGSTATFELSQDDAEILQQSVAQGDITLTLRPIGTAKTFPGKSHSKVQKESSEVSSLTVYRSGQPQTVAVVGN